MMHKSTVSAADALSPRPLPSPTHQDPLPNKIDVIVDVFVVVTYLSFSHELALDTAQFDRTLFIAFINVACSC